MNAKVGYGEYTPHWFADKFPLIAGKAFDEFVVDIRKHGLRDPIVVRGKTLIDGRCRTRAALKAGVELRVEEFGTDDELAIINYIVSKNLQRRDLKTGQRATLVLEADTALVELANKRKVESGRATGRGHVKVAPKSGQPLPTKKRAGRVDHQLAKLAGVASSTIAQAKAVKKADPELAAEVTAGKVTLNSAYVKVRGRAARAPNIPAKPPKLNGAQVHMQRNDEMMKTRRVLTQKDVDPDFVGSEADFIGKYGFVWMHTAPELASQRFRGLALGLHQSTKTLKEFVKGQRGDVEKLNKVPHAKDIGLLEEAIDYLKPLIAEAETWLRAAKRLRSDKAASPVRLPQVATG